MQPADTGSHFSTLFMLRFVNRKANLYNNSCKNVNMCLLLYRVDNNVDKTTWFAQ